MKVWRQRRGSVLGQVMIFTVIGAVIAAAILRARMQPAMATARMLQTVNDDLKGQSALNRVDEVWARLGPCASDASASVACSGSGCSCTCATPEATVRASDAGGSCVLMTDSNE